MGLGVAAPQQQKLVQAKVETGTNLPPSDEDGEEGSGRFRYQIWNSGLVERLPPRLTV